MTDKRARVPGPDHPITIERNPARVVVSVAGRVIADTREAVTLREASYAAVQYIPRKDVDMSALERTAHATCCPYKGPFIPNALMRSKNGARHARSEAICASSTLVFRRTMIGRHCEACMTIEPADPNPGSNTGKYSEANQRGD